MRLDATGNAWEWWKNFWDDAKEWLKTKKEEAENNANITTTSGITGSAAFGGAVSISAGITRDTKGNIGLLVTTNGGGGFPSVGAGSFFSFNNAPTIYDQRGMGATVGASGGTGVLAVGGEYNMIIDQKNKKVYHGGTLSVTYGLYPTIVEVHGEVGNTWVWGFNIYDVAIGIVDFIRGN